MEQRDKQPNQEVETALSAVTEELQRLKYNVLQLLQQDVERLQAEKSRLQEDIQRLQLEKDQLQQDKQNTQQQALARQLAQLLANHLSAQIRASLTNLTPQPLEEKSPSSQDATEERGATKETNDHAYQLLASLNATLSTTIKAVQQDLNSYQSGISQQLQRMSSLEQQGEAILQELVNRLQTALLSSRQHTASTPSIPDTEAPSLDMPPIEATTTVEELLSSLTTESLDSPPASTFNWTIEIDEDEAEEDKEQEYDLNYIHTTTPLAAPEIKPPREEEAPPATKSDKSISIEEFPVFLRRRVERAASETPSGEAKTEESVSGAPLAPERPRIPVSSSLATPNSASETEPFWTRYLTPAQQGLTLIILSVVALSVYKVIVRVLFQPNSEILWLFNVGTLLTPTLGNTLLIHLLRMLVAVPIMAFVAPKLHPRVWTDMQNLFYPTGRNRTVMAEAGKRILFKGFVSGCFLFLSQILIYIAISQISTGIAATLFFVYPIVTIFLSWLLFGDRPTPLRLGMMIIICIGGLLVLSPGVNPDAGNMGLGIITAISSGIAFAFYVMLTQISASRLHPVSLSLIHFSTMLILSFVGLMVVFPTKLGMQLNLDTLLGVIGTGILLGLLTIGGYVLNHFGIRQLGTIRASLVGASDPALTMILAWLIIQEDLLATQFVGVLLVSLAVAAISWEKLRNQVKPAQATNG
ncbi:MAG: EamA family transporter [Nostocaceae cyanobacterium]|nr:EamA family transporter [Nostocaceae cyanobacterium]